MPEKPYVELRTETPEGVPYEYEDEKSRTIPYAAWREACDLVHANPDESGVTVSRLIRMAEDRAYRSAKAALESSKPAEREMPKIEESDDLEYLLQIVESPHDSVGSKMRAQKRIMELFESKRAPTPTEQAEIEGRSRPGIMKPNPEPNYRGIKYPVEPMPKGETEDDPDLKELRDAYNRFHQKRLDRMMETHSHPQAFKMVPKDKWEALKTEIEAVASVVTGGLGKRMVQLVKEIEG